MAEVLPIQYPRRSFAGVDHESGPAIAATMMSERGNVRSELVPARRQEFPGRDSALPIQHLCDPRSEKRRVGKECRPRRQPQHYKTNKELKRTYEKRLHH